MWVHDVGEYRGAPFVLRAGAHGGSPMLWVQRRSSSTYTVEETRSQWTGTETGTTPVWSPSCPADIAAVMTRAGSPPDLHASMTELRRATPLVPGTCGPLARSAPDRQRPARRDGLRSRLQGDHHPQRGDRLAPAGRTIATTRMRWPQLPEARSNFLMEGEGRRRAHARGARDVRDSAPSGELPGSRRHDAAVRGAPRGAGVGLPALARPRRRDRDGGVRAWRNPFPARGLRAAHPDDVVVLRFEASGTELVELGSHYYRRYDAFERIEGTRPRGGRGRPGARGSRVPLVPRTRRRGGRDRRAARRPHHRSGADAVTILVAAATDFRTRRPRAGVPRHARRRGLAVPSPANSARATSRATARRCGASDFDSPASPIPSLAALPTDVRLERVKTGADDPGLVERHFQFGRYLLLGSSRHGTLPANLQGIWNESYQPAWDSKFTININLQMNYWPAEVANLAECHEPLFDLDRPASCHRRGDRREHYGCRGFVAHHNTDLWADTATLDNVLCGLWPAGAAWLAHHLWERYAFTLDEDFLRDRAYPGMKEAARFVSTSSSSIRRPESSCSAPRSRPRPLPRRERSPHRPLPEPGRRHSIIVGLFERLLLAPSFSVAKRTSPRRCGRRSPSPEDAGRRSWSAAGWREDYEE